MPAYTHNRKLTRAAHDGGHLVRWNVTSYIFENPAFALVGALHADSYLLEAEMELILLDDELMLVVCRLDIHCNVKTHTKASVKERKRLKRNEKGIKAQTRLLSEWI